MLKLKKKHSGALLTLRQDYAWNTRKKSTDDTLKTHTLKPLTNSVKNTVSND